MLTGTLILCFILQLNGVMNFTGHRLYEILPSTTKELDLINELISQAKLDLWTFPANFQQGLNVRAPPSFIDNLEEKLKSLDLQFKVVVDDVQQLVDKERQDNPYEKAEEFQGEIKTSINAYLDSLPQRYPNIVSVQVFGYTYEGNPIKGVEISSFGYKKPALFIDTNIHAREWVAGAIALYIIDQLVRGYKNDPEITRLVDTFDWYIIPITNVDGYIYTWTEDRMWRKNRIPPTQRSDETICWGADPNRNFDIGFGRNGTRDDMCSSMYTGPFPFSEAESRAIRDGVLSLGSRLKMYFSLHSYSQLWMTPYGYTLQTPKDFTDHMKALVKAVVPIANTHGQWYKHGTIAKTVYAASGNSADWVYSDAHVKYSFAVELRDTGKYSFMLPNNFIIPTAEETFAGIKQLRKLFNRK